MREPRAFAELETKIEQEEKPAQKPAEPYYFAEEYAEAKKSKPYKSVGGYDFHIVPYHEIDRKSGKPNFSIRYNKAGEKLGGYSTGLDFDTEDKAREQIDKWEKDPGFQKTFSASDAKRRKSMAGATKQGFPADMGKDAEELEKYAHTSKAFSDQGKIFLTSSWRKTPKQVYKDYLDIKKTLNSIYGEGKYKLSYKNNTTRDNGKEVAGEFEITPLI